MITELPSILMTRAGSVQHVTIGESEPGEPGDVKFGFSDIIQIPGTSIISALEIYKGNTIILTRNADGSHQIRRSIDQTNYDVVHTHPTEIYGIFSVDMGIAVFCATDGWWITLDSGRTWNDMGQDDYRIIDSVDVMDGLKVRYTRPEQLETRGPQARAAVTWEVEGGWEVLAYGNDHKVYHATFDRSGNMGCWTVVYEGSSLWTGEWYPAMSGSSIGVLVGNGPYIVRCDDAVWKAVAKTRGIVQNILVSDQTSRPAFLITIELPDHTNDLMWTYDMGSTLVADMNRVSPASTVAAAYPTGADHNESWFLVTGKRSPDDVDPSVQIIKHVSY